jgi:outer membrane protein assembly factor BamB
MNNPQSPLPIVVMGFSKHVVAVHAFTGQHVWEVEVTPNGPIHVDQGRVIFTSGFDVVCLDYMTGALLWKASVPKSLGMELNMMLFAGCLIITGLGEAACFNMQNGAQLWYDGFKGRGVANGPMAAPGVTARPYRRHA